jgi:hypothetical protein
LAGDGGYNYPWSWHLDPDTIQFADAAIEVCDGLPIIVESDLDYWLNSLGYYCPLQSQVIAESQTDEAIFNGQLVDIDHPTYQLQLEWQPFPIIPVTKYFYIAPGDGPLIPGLISLLGILGKTPEGLVLNVTQTITPTPSLD